MKIKHLYATNLIELTIILKRTLCRGKFHKVSSSGNILRFQVMLSPQAFTQEMGESE